MLSNYFTIALRSLWKNKGIAAINVVGLSVGLACFALFLLNVLNEFSFNRFHANADRIYVVSRNIGEIDGEPARKSIFLPMPLGPALKADLPDVEQFVRFPGLGDAFVRTPKGVVMERAGYSDAAFFEMFNFPFLYGDARSAFASPNNVVLTKKMANKLFGESNPTGKALEIKVEEVFESFTVSAVLEDYPSNSGIVHFEILLPFEKFASTKRGKRVDNRWTHSSMPTYVRLRDGSGLPKDTARLAEFFLKYYPNEEKELRAKGQWNKPEPPVSYGLVPIKSMHHDADLGVNPSFALILLAIGGIILLIACINFTTLAIGRSAGRAREIGVRKVVGASRSQLSRQFMTEAVLLSGLSTAVGIGLARVLLPMFNQLAGTKLKFDFGQFPELYWLLPGLVLLVGLLAGSYPAFVLSGFSPLETLKSKLKIGGENWFTRSLVTFQFVLSVGLISCTFIMLRQLDYLRSKSPGFDKENVIVVNAEGTTKPSIVLERFKQSLAARPEIMGVSGSELLLGKDAGWSSTSFDYQGKTRSLYEYYIDHAYMKVLGLQLLAGRNFDPAITADSVTSVIFNEAAVRDFGWTNESAIGQVLTGYNEANPQRNPIVIGVVRDYNFSSLHEKVQPMMFTNYHDYEPLQFFVRIAPGDPRKSLESLRSAWASAEPILPFRYVFLDDNIQKFYEPEARLSETIGLGGGIAVLLACLGLFGLAALSTMNRTKEIGIRKVLGASVFGITGLLSRDFLKLVFIAILIASPAAYYFMQKWLADFAYRIDLEWWMFAVAGAAAVAVALFTVAFQSVRAALANPVESLRSE